jgi:PAS domain-containing protein
MSAAQADDTDSQQSLVERPVPPNQVQPPRGQPGSPGDAWFGPGVPLPPVAPWEEVAGRQFDFPAGYNLGTTPRRHEGVSFQLLRGLADYDLVRLAIETRKDQLARVGWSILPKRPPGQKYSNKADETCAEIEKFLRKPDGVHRWDQWVRILAEETLVIDAVAIYRRRTKDGKPYALEIIDGSTINVLIDRTGRRPLPPAPAFQQVLKGMPAAWFTSDELVYSVRNPRANKAYGLSPVEQIITYVNIGLRRLAKQLHTFTEGNIPEALMTVPENWTVEQIATFQRYWDALMENAANRRRMKFVPAGMNYWPIHPDNQLLDQFDEWLARIVAYAFSLPPTPFVRQMNRATAESAYQTALEEGLEPMLQWLKGIIDEEIEKFLGYPGYEIVWDDIRKTDVVEQHALDLQDLRAGLKSIDEIRESRGDEPLGLPHIFWGIGPLGFMSLDAVKKAIQLGLDMPQMPPPLDMGPGVMPGEDPLANADPALLQQLGIAPDQTESAPDENAVTNGSQAGMQGMPTAMNGSLAGMQGIAKPRKNLLLMLRNAKGNPQVAAALRALEGRK